MPKKNSKRGAGSSNDSKTLERRIDYRIFDLYSEMTKSEKRLADFILECEGTFASYSAAELARRSNVSKATAVRFFRRLGYESFNEAISQSRQHRNWGSPLYDDSSALLPGDGGTHGKNTHLENHVKCDIQNLIQLLDWIDEKQVGQAIEKLSSAGSVWVIGFRNSYALAHYACGVLSNIRNGVRLFPGPAFDAAEAIAGMSANDVVLAIGFRRRTKSLYSILQNANNMGVSSILVTDKTSSETAALCDIVLRCQNRGYAMFDSYVSGVSLLNYVATSVASKLELEAKTHMADIEDIHRDLDDLM